MYESKVLEFETHMHEFLKYRCIVLDMSIINSTPAAIEYILSAVSKKKSLAPQEFVVIGDALMSRKAGLDLRTSWSHRRVMMIWQLCSGSVWENEVLGELLSKCRLITTLKLMNLKMTCHTAKLNSIEKLKKLESNCNPIMPVVSPSGKISIEFCLLLLKTCARTPSD